MEAIKDASTWDYSKAKPLLHPWGDGEDESHHQGHRGGGSNHISIKSIWPVLLVDTGEGQLTIVS